MVGQINTSNIAVDNNGRVSFSGLSTGIDSKGVVDSIIAARQIPVDRLKTDVTRRTDQVAAYGDLKALLSTLRDSLSKLYGAVSFQNANNVFEAKEAFAATSRTDGQAPSAATSLIGVSVTNAAAAGSHSLEVLSTAKAHKISTKAVNSLSNTLGTALGLSNGSFKLNATTIDVFATDTLTDLRERINAANTGAGATGVAASIVSVGASENYLVLTSSNTGAANAMTLTVDSGGAMAALGLSDDGGATFKNQLQAALDARLKADGLKDLDRFESDLQSSQTALLSTMISSAPATGSFDVTIGVTTNTINYNAATGSLTTLKDAINTAFGSAVASISTEPTGVRLVINGSGSTVTVTDTNGLLADLGMDNDLVIARASNTVNDLFSGTTVSLLNAEEGTTIKLDVERDLSAAKTMIESFVTAYNAVRVFVNEQNKVDASTGLKSTDAGVLFGSQVLASVTQQLGAVIGAGVQGVSSQFSILSQIGINIVKDANLTDPTLKNTLEFGTNVAGQGIDEALLNNIADVRKLFSFDFSSSNPQVSLLAFNGKTTYDAAGYVVNIQPSTSTNLALYSEQADNAYWTTIRAAVSANGATAPDGTMTADGIVGDATNNTHLLLNAAPQSVTAGQTYTFSSYVKAGAHSQARLALSGAFPADAYIDVNLATGSLVTLGNGLDTVKVEDAGSGWYRVSATATATATGNAWFERYAGDVGSIAFAGDGATVDTWVWGAQFESLTNDTVAVPTDGATRATVTTSIATAPDGTMTADGVDADNTLATHLLTSATLSATQGQSYTFITYAKAGDRPVTKLNFGGAAFDAATAYMTVDLSSGATLATGSAITSSRVTDAGSGWYRIEITAAAASTGDGVVERASLGAGGAIFAGDGNPATYDTYYWGGKRITGTPTGNYLPTTSATVSGPTANVAGAATGADNGTATFANNTMTVTAGGAEGLQLFYGGTAKLSAATINFTVGVGAQMFFDIDQLMASDGIIEAEIATLDDQNETANDRIDAMLERLDYQRTQLTDRFIAMETAMATATRILDSIKQTTDAMFQNK